MKFIHSPKNGSIFLNTIYHLEKLQIHFSGNVTISYNVRRKYFLEIFRYFNNEIEH